MPIVPPVIKPFDGTWPTIDDSVFIADGAAVIGDVVIGPESSVWYGVVIRGDENYVRIGSRTNVQDGTVIHVTLDKFPTVIGDGVTIGHGARVHGCTIGNGCLIGISATVLDGAIVESGAMVAAGALVAPGKRVPSGELWAGCPAKKMRDLTQADHDYFVFDAEHYVKMAGKHKQS